MIEVTVKNLLEAELPGMTIELEIPKNMPEKFVVMHIVDRGRDNLINAVTMEFDSYADSKYEAALLDETIRDAIDTINETSDISFKFSNGDNSNDTVFKKYRYRCYFNIYF